MAKESASFTFMDHTADLGIRVRGGDLRELFGTAALALRAILVQGASSQAPVPVTLSVAGRDLADLMVRWLSEILYLFQGENRIITDVDIHSLGPAGLEATVLTVPFDRSEHEIENEIKAVTYHQIEVAKKGDGWESTIILDL